MRSFVDAWRSASTLGRGGLVLLAGLFIASGAFLFWLAWLIWRRRAGAAGALAAVLVALLGFAWIGALYGAGRSDPSSSGGSLSTTTTAVAVETSTTGAVTTSSTGGADVPPASTAAAPTTAGTSGAPSTTPTPVPAPTASVETGDEVLLPDLLATVRVERETPSGYDRDLFDHWSDLDGDGCDTRDEVLIRDSRGTTQVDPFGCEVVAGDWYSPYDGVWVSDPGRLDIDHVVPLKEAWDSGAIEWDDRTREVFANDLGDPRALIAVTAESNRSKGAADPSNWMPPNRDDWCRYLAAWVVVKVRWKLSMDESEYGRIRNLLDGECRGLTADAGVPVQPSGGPSKTTSTVAP